MTNCFDIIHFTHTSVAVRYACESMSTKGEFQTAVYKPPLHALALTGFMIMIYLCYCMYWHMIQICSGITSGRVLNREFYAQRLQKLIHLHLLTGCFMKISLRIGAKCIFEAKLASVIFVYVHWHIDVHFLQPCKIEGILSDLSLSGWPLFQKVYVRPPAE